MKKILIIFLSVISIALLLTMLSFAESDAVPFAPSELDGVDFELYTEQGKDLRILALSDVDLCNAAANRRTNSFTIENRVYYSDLQNIFKKYINQAVHRSNPDIIILTGNMINGIDDPNGALFNYFCKTIDSFNIPWAYVFGANERTGEYPLERQIADLANYKNCIFKKGDVSGCNYNIAVVQGEEVTEILYLLDTNPKEGVPDIGDDQEDWFDKSYKSFVKENHNVPTYIFMSAAPRYMFAASKQYGVEVGVSATNPVILDSYDAHGKYMTIPTGVVDTNRSLLALMKENNTKGMFFGCEPKIAASVMYDGIRLTHLMKSGEFNCDVGDYIGSTLINISGDKCNVDFIEHLQYPKFFTDYSNNSWYSKSVRYCYENALMVGLAPTEFGTHGTLTREMFVTLLAALEEIDESLYIGTSFNDVKVGKWYSPAIEWGHRNGICDGYAGNFGLKQTLTREQMALMLLKYSMLSHDIEATTSESLMNYTDYTEISDWALDAMHWAHSNVLMIGVEGEEGFLILPDKAITRAETAVIIEGFIERFCDEYETDPERTGRREGEIIFIGNSFTYYGEAPEKTQLISEYYGTGYTFIDSTQPSFFISADFDLLLAMKEIDPAYFTEADIVVIQESYLSDSAIKVMELFPRDTKFYLLSVWSDFYISGDISDQAGGRSVRLIPAGTAYRSLLNKGYDENVFLAEDNFHPNDNLGFVTALTAYAVIADADITEAPTDILSDIYPPDVIESVMSAVDRYSEYNKQSNN